MAAPDLNPYDAPRTTEFLLPADDKQAGRGSRMVSNVIMWVGWLFFALLAVLSAKYLTRSLVQLNSFVRPFGVFEVGMLLIPVVVCGSLRFWLSRIRKPWLALLPFLLGVLFAYQAMCSGIFLVPEYFIIFQILSAVLFLVYLPLFVRLTPKTPRLNVGE